MMRKSIAFFTAAMLFITLPAAAWASESAQTDTDASAQSASPVETEGETEDTPEAGSAPQDFSSQGEEEVQDHIVTTNHTAVIQGKELSYTAQAGTMVLETGGNNCEIFFTAYTLDGVEDPSTRPVTFAFNGGPGSASIYLHVGCLGPRRIDVDENGYAKTMPVKMVDNENSLLDLTDLVIIDAVGTGYSRSLEDSIDPFVGYDNDNRTFGDFIRQYINRNNRWGSEKYVAGESYGTPRAVGICKYLADTYSLYLNGLILISSINDFSATVFTEGNEIPYATFIPTYAADAWYQGVLAREYQDMELEAYLDVVRGFVDNEYVPALFNGSQLTEEELDALAEKYAGYTGLKKEYVLRSNLRVELDDFLTELLKDQKLVVGRMDGRMTGPATTGSMDGGESDPSNLSFNLSFGNAFNNYIVSELGFQTDRPYIPTNDEVNASWSFPISPWGGYVSQEQVIHDCISQNPFLKIWVLCGYYDGATPFHTVEYTFRHVFLNDDLKDHVSFTYYPCGHMIYMEKASFDKFRADAQNWLG
jgi:carboxypeptidase C (cathepsin A)